MAPRPCPFCGADWVARGDGWVHGKVVKDSPHDQFCILQGSFFDARSAAEYHRMAAPTYHYEVVDGLPVFNQEGRGDPAPLEFINGCFDYIRGRT